MQIDCNNTAVQDMPTNTNIDIPTADELKRFQQEYATPADASAVEAFVRAAQVLTARAAYRSMRADDAQPRHCVRCHATYTDAENSAAACAIPHVFSSDCRFSGRVIGYDKVYEYEAQCCDGVVLEEEGAGNMDWINPPDEPCFEGYHTTDVEEAEKDYNDANIFPCEMKDGKCVQRYLEFDEDSPEIH